MSGRRWITLVGESPAPWTTVPFAPGTSSRRRLEQTIGAWGVDQMVLRSMYLNSWPTRFWSAEESRRRAEAMQFRTPIVLLAGQRVAAAFKLRGLRYFTPQFHRGRIFYVVPHLSGLNRWWNIEENRRQARMALKSILSSRKYLTDLAKRIQEGWLDRGERGRRI